MAEAMAASEETAGTAAARAKARAAPEAVAGLVAPTAARAERMAAKERRAACAHY